MAAATIHLDVERHHVVYKGKRHIFLGKTGPKERWTNTHRDDVSFEFHGRTFSATADAIHLEGKGLLGFMAKPRP